jgi:biopolymer transport protein ExbB
LLGLLGTVVGMIRVFTDMTIAGTGNANALAGGISEALITTATGLAVAIPALVMHRYFTGKIDAIVVGLEQETIKLVDALHSERKTEYDV